MMKESLSSTPITVECTRTTAQLSAHPESRHALLLKRLKQPEFELFSLFSFFAAHRLQVVLMTVA